MKHYEKKYLSIDDILNMYDIIITTKENKK